MLDDTQVRILIIILIGLGLILFPFSVYRQIKGESKLWGKALDSARNPWKQEDEDLAELGRRVERLKKGKRT